MECGASGAVRLCGGKNVYFLIRGEVANKTYLRRKIEDATCMADTDYTPAAGVQKYLLTEIGSMKLHTAFKLWM